MITSMNRKIQNVKAIKQISKLTPKITPKLFSTTIPKSLNGERIDITLVKVFPEFSRAQIRKYIDEGMVFLNKKRIWIAKYVVNTNDLLEVNTENGDNKKVQFDSKNILFENDNFLIVNKPAGMVVEDVNHNFPLFQAIKSLDTNNAEQDFFAVHRIDKETSGLLIVAKSVQSQQDLVEKWSQKKVQKTYQCLCFGVPPKLVGSINTNIGQHAGKNQYGINKKHGEGGKTALTAYKVNAVLQKGMASIVSCEPKSGRSHQIRIHLSSIDCPIIGDKIYSNKFKLHFLYQIANRQMLHASQLIFELYGNKYNFHAPVPSDFNQMAKYIKTAKNLTSETKTYSPVLSKKPSGKNEAEKANFIKQTTKTTKLRPSNRRSPAVKVMKKAIFEGKKKTYTKSK